MDPTVPQNIAPQNSNLPKQQKQEQQSLLKRIIFSRVVIILVILFVAGAILIPIFNVIYQIVTTPTYEQVFNTIKMPSNFTLIATIPGNSGVGGTASLEKKYKVQGTRESVLKELEPVLDSAGYNLADNGSGGLDIKHAGYGFDYYEAFNKNHAGLTIWLEPANEELPPPAATLNPQAEVKEVDLMLR